MTQNRIALKPYLEQIKEFCLPLSKEELTEVVAGLGKDVSTSERMGFLEKLESILPGHTPLKVPETVGIDDVLNDIQGLRESIEERVESIEDGSFWDDPDVYDEDGYDDEDPEYVSDEQIKDVMDAREGPMGGLDAFLPEWKMMLGPLEMSSRAGFLLLEAVNLTDGISGVSRLARQWRNSQPRGYLFWSNKHRGAYDRAARVLGSLAETHIAMGNEKKAMQLLRHYYQEKYNRFSAFRREVKSVVAGSAALQRCGFL